MSRIEINLEELNKDLKIELHKLQTGDEKAAIEIRDRFDLLDSLGDSDKMQIRLTTKKESDLFPCDFRGLAILGSAMIARPVGKNEGGVYVVPLVDAVVDANLERVYIGELRLVPTSVESIEVELVEGRK